MTTQPPPKVESTGHRMATRLDVLASALFARLKNDETLSINDMAMDYWHCEEEARGIIAALDALNAGESKQN